jgi:hypothetical protein
LDIASVDRYSQPAKTQRSATSLERSRQADEKGLHGKVRKPSLHVGGIEDPAELAEAGRMLREFAAMEKGVRHESSTAHCGAGR